MRWIGPFSLGVGKHFFRLVQGLGKFDNSILQARKRASAGDLSGALDAVDVALAIARDARIFRARLLIALGRPREALEDIAAADMADAPLKFLEMRLGLEEELGKFDAAIATLDRMIDMANDPAAFFGKRAVILQTLGDFQAAHDDLDRAIALRPLDGELYRLRGGLAPAGKDGGQISDIRNALAKVPSGSAAAVHFEFALGKALEDTEQYAEAFAAFKRGNQGMRALRPFDIQTRLAQTKAVREAFGDVTPDKLPVAGASDMAPIFVTGMPRSGTTLVEHILSSHPDVVGGGEASFFGSSFTARVGDPATSQTLDVSPETLRDVGEAYCARMQERFATERRLTDKSLQSALLAGPILTALPKARIVVVLRDPKATALSLYKQVFRDGKQLFSYDLDDIATYQRDFDDLVKFWAARLPERFIVISYEDVVTSPERAIRTLLDQVGLSWNAACLQPERNNRPVQTLSAVSVRAPIGLSALDFWKNYEAELA